MNQIKHFLDVLMGNPACTLAITSLDFNQPDCFKLAISKGLSLGIVLGALVVKVPQIVSILRAQSVKVE